MLQSCMSTSAPPLRWSPSVVAQIPTDKGSALVTKTSAINAVISNAIFIFPYCNTDTTTNRTQNICLGGTAEFYSKITISLNFTAEHAENAEASGTPARIKIVLKLCALGDLRGDQSSDF